MNLERANWQLRSGRDWYVAWFHECLSLIDKFTDQRADNLNTFGDNTNLCHYARVTVLWGPLIIFGQLFTAFLAFSILTWLPIMAFSFTGYMGILSTFAVVGAMIFSLYHGLSWLASSKAGEAYANVISNFLDRWFARPALTYMIYPTRRGVLWAREASKLKNTEGVSFWNITWTNIITAKHQVCPLITIGGREEAP